MAYVAGVFLDQMDEHVTHLGGLALVVDQSAEIAAPGEPLVGEGDLGRPRLPGLIHARLRSDRLVKGNVAVLRVETS